VSIRIVSHAVDHFAFLIQRRLLEQITTETREFDCITVQIGEILRYRCSFGVVPGTLSDAVRAFTAAGRREPACLGKRAKCDCQRLPPSRVSGNGRQLRSAR